MIAKGLDFSRVTLVGVIMADVGLNLPDFRAAEKTFQIITQVAGRAGRSALGGEVLVQTHSPDEMAIQLSREHDYVSFADRELISRRELGYPPFGKLTLMVLRSSDESRVQSAADKLTGMLRQQVHSQHLRGVHILGPAPAPLSRIRGQHRWQVLLKGTGSAALRRVVQGVMGQSSRWPPWPGVKVKVVVDPIEML
jgi:primosomal protein N' (replication factor Y)